MTETPVDNGAVKDPFDGRTYWQLVWTQFRKNRLAVLAGWMVVLLISVAIFAPFLANGYPLYAKMTRPQTYQSNFDGWDIGHTELVDDLRAGRAELLQKGLANCQATLAEMAGQLGEESQPPIDALREAYERTGSDAAKADELEKLGAAAREVLDPEKATLARRAYFPLIRMLGGLDLFFMTLYLVVVAYFLGVRRWVDRWLKALAVDPFNAFFMRIGVVLLIPAIVAALWHVLLPPTNDTEPYQLRALELEEGERIIFPPVPYNPDRDILKTGSYLSPAWSEALPFHVPGSSTHVPQGGGEPIEFAPHMMGTDGKGYDAMARMIWGARVSLSVGFVAVSIYVFIGLIIGALAGYFMSWPDAIISRIIEVVICFPPLFLIIIVMAYLPPSIYTVMIVIGVTGWPGVARLVRGEFIRLGTQEFVLAAQALGIGTTRIIFRHVLPNALAPVLVVAAFGIAGAILTESALSFLGIGVPPSTPSWGSLLREAQGDPSGRWWLTLFPGFAVFVAVTAYNLLAEGVRDAIDPRLKE